MNQKIRSMLFNTSFSLVIPFVLSATYIAFPEYTDHLIAGGMILLIITGIWAMTVGKFDPSWQFYIPVGYIMWLVVGTCWFFLFVFGAEVPLSLSRLTVVAALIVWTFSGLTIVLEQRDSRKRAEA